MKNSLTWLVIGAIAVSVVVVVRQNQLKSQAARQDPLMNQLNSGKLADMQLGDTADNSGFSRLSNSRI